MDRFSQETIQIIALVFLGATIVGYLIQAAWHKAQRHQDRADAFLRYRSASLDKDKKPVSSDLLRATLMASSFSLASAIYVYIEWAAADGMFVLWSPIAWCAGAVVLFAMRHSIFRESRDSWTLHAFLSDKYDSKLLMRAASVITSIVFLLQVAAEVFVGLAALQVFFGATAPLWLLCLAIAFIFISYSLIGGLPSVLVTDHFQFRLTAFTLLVAAIILFNDGGATAVETIATSFRETFIPTGSAWIVLAGLVCLNLPLFITDMSVWQRIGATDSEDEVNKGLGSFVFHLLFWMSLLVCLGTGFAIFFEPAEGFSAAQAMIGYFKDTLVFPLLLAGFVAALLSTGDTFLIASVQTVLVDWKYAHKLEAVQFKAESLSIDEHRRMLKDSRFGIVILGLGSVGLGYLFFQTLPSLLDLLFVIFGLQTALAPAVVWGLLGKARPEQRRAALASLFVGGVVALICLIFAIRGATLYGVTLGLWAPVLVLSVAIVIFAVLSPKIQTPAE